MRVYQKTIGGVYFMEGEVATKRFNRTTGLRNRDEAEQFLLRYAEQRRLESVGIVVVPPPLVVVPTLTRVCALWSKAHSHSSSVGHLRNVADHVRLHLQAIAHCPIDEIDPLDWANCLNEILKNHARSTSNGVVRSLKLLLRWALENRLITEMPLKPKKLPEKKRPRKVVHLGEYTRLVELCDQNRNPVVGGLVRFILGTGVRLTEALAARWEYFDERARTYIPQGREIGDGTKGGEAEHMAMPDWLFNYLMSLPHTGEYIFPNREGQPYSVSLLKKPLHAAAKELGLPRLYAHLLRVSMATNLIDQGIDIRTVQEALRHGSSTTTEGYIELPSAGLRRAKYVMDGPAIPLPASRPAKAPKSPKNRPE